VPFYEFHCARSLPSMSTIGAVLPIDVSLRPINAVADTKWVSAASTDTSITQNTYFPPNMNVIDTAAYLGRIEDTYFVIDVDGRPAGMIGYNPVDTTHFKSYVSEEGSVEISTWLLAEYRGKGIANIAYDQLIPMLKSHGIMRLVSVVYSATAASLARIRKSGAEQVCQFWWEDKRDVPPQCILPSGLCDVWVRFI
jgi:RimJ/RimL family protein N-acetyltransferase